MNVFSLDPSADLLTIKDVEENKFVSTHLKEYYFITGKAWLGMQFTGKEKLDVILNNIWK